MQYGEERLKDAEADSRKAIALDPLHAGGHVSLALIQAQRGEAAAALETLDAMRPWMVEESELTAYNSACVLGLVCGTIASEGESSPLAAEADELKARALRLVEKSIELGFRDAPHMKADPDLNPLRGPELDRIISRAANSDG